MTAATQVQWRVQIRVARNKPWKNMGLFETRCNARYEAAFLRNCYIVGRNVVPGFGNTRVVRYVKAKKGSK